jgi:hypothetical protein
MDDCQPSCGSIYANGLPVSSLNVFDVPENVELVPDGTVGGHVRQMERTDFSAALDQRKNGFLALAALLASRELGLVLVAFLAADIGLVGLG